MACPLCFKWKGAETFPARWSHAAGQGGVLLRHLVADYAAYRRTAQRAKGAAAGDRMTGRAAEYRARTYANRLP
jgi:hypothetical protein